MSITLCIGVSEMLLWLSWSRIVSGFAGREGARSRGRMFGWRCMRRTRRGFLRGSRAGWWRCRSWPRSGRARPGWWSGAYGGGWIGVMRSSSRPGSWRPVRALAWWGRALSGTTAVLPVPVSCWSGSGARVVCQVFWFCSVGCGVTVLLVGEGVGEGLGRLLPVHGRSGALSFRGLHAAGPGLVLQADLADRVHLPALIQQGLDLGRRPGHASGDGFLVAVLVERVGRFGVRPAQGREQPVRGVRLVFGVGQGLHDVTYRWDVPELGVDARLGGRLGEDFLEFLFLVAGEFRRVLVPRMAGQDRAHPGGLPVGQPFLHCPLGPFDHLRDDVDSDSFGGVQDRFCFHPNQHMIVGTLLPPDQDGGFFRGDPDLHAPIISGTAQEIQEKYGFVSCQPYLNFNI